MREEADHDCIDFRDGTSMQRCDVGCGLMIKLNRTFQLRVITPNQSNHRQAMANHNRRNERDKPIRIRSKYMTGVQRGETREMARVILTNHRALEQNQSNATYCYRSSYYRIENGFNISKYSIKEFTQTS